MTKLNFLIGLGACPLPGLQIIPGLSHLLCVRRTRSIGQLIIVLSLFLAGCAQPKVDQERQNAEDKPINVVVTTTILGDVVKNIGKEHINLQILIPVGVDEHSFQFTPEDVTKVAGADIVLINGAGLENFIKPLIENVGKDVNLVSVSDGIDLLQAKEDLHGADETGVEDGDPHVWMDPNLVKTWADNITDALSLLAPQFTSEFQINSARYKNQLDEIDAWIREQTDQVPADNRRLVTDHQIFTYFAHRYGFDQVGAIIPAYTTIAAPSARELAALEDAIRQLGVRAIFVGNTVNPDLARRVAEDTGVRLVQVYTGSLTDGPPAGNYLDYMRSNVNSIVEALR